MDPCASVVDSPCIFTTLPALVREILQRNDRVFLLNEMYIYKPASSPCSSFFWHRDADVILENVPTCADPKYHAFQQRQQMHSSAESKCGLRSDPLESKTRSDDSVLKYSRKRKKNHSSRRSPSSVAHTDKRERVENVPFVSFWIPLDNVNKENGTLQFLAAEVEGSGINELDVRESKKSMHAHIIADGIHETTHVHSRAGASTYPCFKSGCMDSKDCSRSNNTTEGMDVKCSGTENASHSHAISGSPGDAVLFTSMCFHKRCECL